MIRTIIANEQDGLNLRSLSLSFVVPNMEFDICSAVKSACMEYCKTEEGKKVFEGNCNCFNWGDFDMYVPNEICIKFGFQKTMNDISDIIVNFDEQLVNEYEIFPAED